MWSDQRSSCPSDPLLGSTMIKRPWQEETSWLKNIDIVQMQIRLEMESGPKAGIETGA
jgi:hypothetical protein